MFVHRHSEGKDQFDRVMDAARGSPELVALGKGGRGEGRFTGRDMIETEQRLARQTQTLADREKHRGRIWARTKDPVIKSANQRVLRKLMAFHMPCNSTSSLQLSAS